MKTTILIKENRTQLVLHPESEHDKSVLDVVENMPNTHRTNLYDRQGGFTMFSEYNTGYDGKQVGDDLMIVFDQTVSQEQVSDLVATDHKPEIPGLSNPPTHTKETVKKEADNV